ncbi:PhzF family phenazine biosynthesis protein [Pelosinus propionicus]|uniref:Trans-2,3-dihydro-3-hydroxyanthranilate isomerase n=1 Tax=Pelosinus propionicus DSM 13327 TaxID=1123291 RepID=A0A1I4NIV7_9FIRM|nr:PhzF family phenazine biosynthesis protein [Pelosinus propionicus]SFM15401.1 trans-2,3-dihydro-3-hydroxyanthranilate isomerase [Pelosinus propionicus DSM 13327]
MQYQYIKADVFTDILFSGNQLAVFPNAEGLDDKTMQLIAREFNLSETVFVFPPANRNNTRKLRIFTPGTELPFAGHPTIGTAFILAVTGEIPLRGEITEIVFEEGVGDINVSITSKDGNPSFSQLSAGMLPKFGPAAPAVEEIAKVLSLSVSDITSTEHSPQAISCGVPFLFVPVNDLQAIKRAKVNLSEWERVLSNYWAPHLYIFTTQTERPESSFHARMFAPAMGIAEDPATGAAATAFAGYLGSRIAEGNTTYTCTIEQGFEMDRSSLIQVTLHKEDNRVTSIKVGGMSVLVGQGFIHVPNNPE